MRDSLLSVRLERLVRYGLCAIVFLTPILVFRNLIFPFVTSKLFVFQLLVAVVFFLWVWLQSVVPAYALSRRIWIRLLPMITLVILLSISSFFATIPNLSFWSTFIRGVGLVMLWHIVALTIIIVSCIRARGQEVIRTIFLASISSAGLVLFSVIFGKEGFNMLFVGKLYQDSPGGGLIGNSSLAAIYLWWNVAIALYVLMSTAIHKTKTMRIVLWTFVVATALSPLMVAYWPFYSSESFRIAVAHPVYFVGSARATVLAVLYALPFAFFFWNIFSKKRWLRIVGILGVGILLISAIYGSYRLLLPSTKIHQKFSDVASGSRFIYWDIAQKAIAEKPFLGWGVDNYTVAFQQYFDPHILSVQNNNESWNDRPHNEFFEMGVAGGFPALVLYLVLLWVGIASFVRAYKKGSISKTQMVIMVSALVAYIIEEQFVFNTLMTYLMFFVVYATGIAMAEYPVATTGYAKKRNWVSIAGAGSISVIAIIWCTSISWSKAGRVHNIINAPLPGSASRYQEFVSSSPMGNYYDLAWLGNQLYSSYQTNKKNILSPGNDAEKDAYRIGVTSMVSVLEKEVDATPPERTDFRRVITLARLLNAQIILSNDLKNTELLNTAVRYGTLAQNLSLNNPEPLWVTAQTLVYAYRFSEADTLLEKAIAIDPTNEESNSLSISLAQLQGNQKLVAERIARAKAAVGRSN